MDTDPEPGKSSGMSFSMKYNPNYEEVEHIISDVTPISNKANPHETTTSIDDLGKSKKNDKSGSIINKYFKTFKTEKGPENESKSESEVIKDNIERKSLDIRNESSGSPIKEYFSKFSKRSDSIDTTTSSDVESIKDGKDSNLNSDRWKLFSDFKYKIAQAVEDIKSSRSSEATDIKEKQGSVDNSSITDSEDQELDPISCASTENQVSSLTSSVQNLSELSPPIISHSSTMTDMDLETTSTSDTNKISTDTSETKQKYQGPSKIKSVQYEDSDIDDNEHMEIESGVEALEDAELVLQNDTTDDILKSPIDQPSVFVKPPMALNLKKDIRRKASFFSYSLICFTGVVLISLSVFPTILMFNGFLIGAWFTYFLNKSYVWILEMLGHENNISPSDKAFIVPDFQHMSISNIPHIVEFEPLKKYEGWTNVYMMGKYDVLTYHISLTQTAFMKLEGSTLRLSFTHNKIPKRGLWNEVLQKVPFYQHRIYNLEGAKIKLLPSGIVKKRHWSKKYPICIILKDKSKMTVYNAKSNSSDTNLPTKDNPNLPLYSKDDINFPYTEQEVKNDTSLIESKSITEDEDSKIKSSPRRGLKLFDRITEKSVMDSPTRSEETGENKKDSSSTRTSSKPIFIKSNKNKDRENMFLDESSFRDNMESVFDDEEPPEIKEMVSISYMDAINNDQKSETNYYGDLKDIIKHNTDEDGTTMETVVLNNEWSKDDAIDGEQNQITLYLFGRTGREKEEWFRRIKIAIDDASIKQTSEIEQIYNNPDEDDNDVTKNNEPYDNLGDELTKLLSSSKENSDSKVRMGSIKSERKSVGSNEMPSVLWTPNSSLKESPLSGKFYAKQDVDFWRYMKDIIEAKSNLEMSEKEIKMSNDVLWFNALFGRIIFDTFRNEAWVTMLQERIQKKLTSLKLPPFMGPLVVTALEFGAESPRIHGASSPILDSRGLWIDLQISYNGKATMTLMTQLNLMSLIEKRDGIGEEMEEKKSHSKKSSEKDLHAVYHSDLDDTAESSSEDEAVLVQLPAPKTSIDVDSPPTPPANIGSSSAKKLMRYVDKIASNKYFQHVTEYKYVKRAMEGVSNTDLKLSVDLCGLVGCLSINIPPPPSDRIWFGFRGNPNLWLKAKPIVGSRVINFTHVTNWIEKKLCKEFEKVLVLPNMEDIYLDSMVAPYID